MRFFMEVFMEVTEKQSRIITVENCETITLNGVEFIAAFDEKGIILQCDFGRIIVEGVDMNGLRDLGDQLKEKLGEGVIVIASNAGDKVNLIAMATDGAMAKGAHAGNLIKGIAALVGGGGGGRPDSAQSGGKMPEKLEEAKNAFFALF